MFCYLINIKKIDFFYKKPTDDNPNYFFWIVAVQDRYRTSPANVDCPLGIFNFWNVIDIDILFAKKIKSKCCVFDIHRIKLAKTAKFFFRALSTEFEVELAPFSVYKDCASGGWVCISCKFNQSGLKKLISCCF